LITEELSNGIPERFSVIAATGFNAVLGIYLFKGFETSNI
jgi:hypothetical protein